MNILVWNILVDGIYISGEKMIALFRGNRLKVLLIRRKLLKDFLKWLILIGYSSSCYILRLETLKRKDYLLAPRFLYQLRLLLEIV